ncbi:MAG: hypothetical protein H7833_15850 [Magnetococcus sp. DMHC-1]|nr:hypothetical protein [Magnetococcales bacterium]
MNEPTTHPGLPDLPKPVTALYRSWDPPPKRMGLGLWRWAVWFKANPRDTTYMQTLFRQHFPDGDFIDVQQHPDWNSHLQTCSQLVLLYPDAIGQGFTALERQVLRQRRPDCPVWVLNGRGRRFCLDRATRRALRWRRGLERFMLLELCLLPLFLLVTPLLLGHDFLRGRR